jgi:hypothetical protein
VPEGPVVNVEDGIGLHQDAGGAVLGVQGVDGTVVLGGVSGVVNPWTDMKKRLQLKRLYLIMVNVISCLLLSGFVGAICKT